jgi:hypothetical protein
MVIRNRLRVHQTLLILVYVMFSTSPDDQNQVQRKFFRLNVPRNSPGRATLWIPQDANGQFWLHGFLTVRFRTG